MKGMTRPRDVSWPQCRFGGLDMDVHWAPSADLAGNPPAIPKRFGWVIQGMSTGPDPVFDEDLGDFPEAAILPTRGALVPEWLLIVPRKPYLSVAKASFEDRRNFVAIADTVSNKIADRAAECILFEHGPSSYGSEAGCGVDQAHLHVVGGAQGFMNRVLRETADLSWSEADYTDPWRALTPGVDYLVLRDGTRALSTPVSNPTSQRLRRAIARALSRGAEWDYRKFPHEANASRTLEMFRGAFGRPRT